MRLYRGQRLLRKPPYPLDLYKNDFEIAFSRSKHMPLIERALYLEHLRKEWESAMQSEAGSASFYDMMDPGRLDSIRAARIKQTEDYGRWFLAKIIEEIEYVGRCRERVKIKRGGTKHPANRQRWPDSVALLACAIQQLVEAGKLPDNRKWQTAADWFVDKNGKDITAKDLASAYQRAGRQTRTVTLRQDLLDLLLQIPQIQ